MFSALGSENQWPGLIVAFVVWVWFIYSISTPKESSTDRTIREQERKIEELLRKLEQRRRWSKARLKVFLILSGFQIQEDVEPEGKCMYG